MEQARRLALEQRARDELAGDYYCGDGLGVNLTLHLSHAGQFRFRWHGCLGLYDRNEGAYGIRDGILLLAPRRPNRRQGFRGTATRFQIIRWGPRRYLIPPEDRMQFCCDINGGCEPRNDPHGLTYLRVGDEKKRVTGVPGIPPSWRSYLLPKPVEGRVARSHRGRATLNVGARQGLKPGMTLWTYGRLTPIGELRILAVNRDSAVAEPLIADDRICAGDVARSR